MCQLQILDVGENATAVCVMSGYSVTVQTGPEGGARLTEHRSGEACLERGDLLTAHLMQNITQNIFIINDYICLHSVAVLAVR